MQNICQEALYCVVHQRVLQQLDKFTLYSLSLSLSLSMLSMSRKYIFCRKCLTTNDIFSNLQAKEKGEQYNGSRIQNKVALVIRIDPLQRSSQFNHSLELCNLFLAARRQQKFSSGDEIMLGKKKKLAFGAGQVLQRGN